MRLWRIVEESAIHCLIALAVIGIFGLTFEILKRFAPDPTVVWWFGNIDTMLQILAAIVLAFAFINSLVRIMADLLIATWKGFPNGDRHFLLV